MMWEPIKKAGVKLEKDFVADVLKYIKPKCLDIVKFEVVGYGYPDYLIVPMNRYKRMFFIEFKGLKTGYSERKQKHQSAICSKYNTNGRIIVNLSPKKDWRVTLDGLL